MSNSTNLVSKELKKQNIAEKIDEMWRSEKSNRSKKLNIKLSSNSQKIHLKLENYQDPINPENYIMISNLLKNFFTNQKELEK